MDKSTALNILLADAVCAIGEFTCEDCPLYGGGPKADSCKLLNDEQVIEAVNVFLKDKE